MTNKQAYDYWRYRYEAAKDYRDEHWEADERHVHQEYVEAMEKAISALETVITAINMWDKRGERRCD